MVLSFETSLTRSSGELCGRAVYLCLSDQYSKVLGEIFGSFLKDRLGVDLFAVCIAVSIWFPVCIKGQKLVTSPDDAPVGIQGHRVVP